MGEIQSVVFNKKFWALKWLNEHNFRTKLDENPTQYRFRQAEPTHNSYLTKKVNKSKGLALVIGYGRKSANHNNPRVVKWVHNGLSYDISLSDRADKRLVATYINPKTGRENTIYFGASGYEVYQDATGLLDKKWIHKDPERRRLFRSRFASKYNGEPNALTLSWHLLW